MKKIVTVATLALSLSIAGVASADEPGAPSPAPMKLESAEPDVWIAHKASRASSRSRSP